MSYRPPIKREQYHNQEVYWFKLLNYINTVEFKDLSTEKQRRILNEFNYIYMSLDILGHLFNQHGKGERRVVAWQDTKLINSLLDKEYFLNVLEKQDPSPDRLKEIRELSKEIERLSVDNHIIYHFSCQRVASEVLKCNYGKVSAVCLGDRPQTGNYVFMFEEDFIANEPLSQVEFLNRLTACPVTAP